MGGGYADLGPLLGGGRAGDRRLRSFRAQDRGPDREREWEGERDRDRDEARRRPGGDRARRSRGLLRERLRRSGGNGGGARWSGSEKHGPDSHMFYPILWGSLPLFQKPASHPPPGRGQPVNK